MDTPNIEDVLVELREGFDIMVEELQSYGRIDQGGREVALVITKIQEARLWAGEALKNMDYNFDNEAQESE